MKFRIHFLLFSLLYSFGLNAQGVDSLHQVLLKHPDPTIERAEILLEIATAYEAIDRDSLIWYYQRGLKLGEQLNDQHLQLRCHDRLAWALLERSLNLDDAEMHLREGLQLANALSDQSFLKAALLRTQGEYYRQKGDLNAGLESLEEAAQLIEKNLEGELSPEEQALYYNKFILILNARGNIFKNQGKCEETIKINRRIQELARKSGDLNQLGFATFNIGSCYFMLGDFPKALDNYLKSPTYTKSERIRQNMQANMNLAVGAVYGEMGLIDSARVYFKKALLTGSDSQRARTQMGTLMNLGTLEMMQERYDSAIHYFEQSMSLARTGNRKAMLAASLAQLGAAHLYAGNLTKAYAELTEAYTLSKELGNSHEITQAEAALAEYYLRTGNNGLAIKYAKSAMSTAEELRLVEIIRSTSLSLSKAYEANGAHNKALAYFEQHVSLKDSLRNEDKVREITQIKMQSEFEQIQERERLEQEQKDALVAEELKRRNVQRNAMIGGLLALALVAIALFWGYRTKQRSNALLEHKNQLVRESLREKEVLLKEIHHRVKNNLQVISSLLSLQSRQVQDESVQEAILEGRNRVRSMAMIHQDLYQTEHLSNIDVRNYINQLSKSLFDSYNIEPDRIRLETNIQPLQLDVDILIPLGLILNELITNALKYAYTEEQAGQLEISLQKEEQNLNLRVADNGQGLPDGFDPSRASSMGYQLIQAFVEKLKGKLTVRNMKGAEIMLSIPQYELA